MSIRGSSALVMISGGALLALGFVAGRMSVPASTSTVRADAEAAVPAAAPPEPGPSAVEAEVRRTCVLAPPLQAELIAALSRAGGEAPKRAERPTKDDAPAPVATSAFVEAQQLIALARLRGEWTRADADQFDVAFTAATGPEKDALDRELSQAFASGQLKMKARRGPRP